MSPEDLAARLGRAKTALQGADYSEELRELEEPIREEFRQNFIRAADESGSPWPPRSYGDHPLLRLTEAMYRAAGGTDSGAALNVRERSMDIGVEGSVIGYAMKHQKGIGVRRRMFIYLNRAARANVKVVFRAVAARRIRRILTAR